MRIFKDSAGREWRICANVATFRRVRELTGLNLHEALHHDTAARLEDPLVLGDVLFALVRPQAVEYGINAEQFGELLAGDTIADATVALLTELPDFFRSPQREALRALLAAIERRTALQRTRTLERLTDPNLAGALDAALERIETAAANEAAPPNSGPAASSAAGSAPASAA